MENTNQTEKKDKDIKKDEIGWDANGSPVPPHPVTDLPAARTSGGGVFAGFIWEPWV